MNYDPRVVSERNAIPGAEYHGPMCGASEWETGTEFPCRSRRTERQEDGTRKCAVCGSVGRIRVTPRGCFVEAVK